MANQQHLDILKQGVEVWNQWRKEHSKEVELDLSGADLRMAKLSQANLNDVILTGANLSEALMVGTDLFQADLRKVQMKGTYLSGTMLCGANLREADLTSAFVVGTNFSLSGNTSEGYMSAGSFTDLRGANLSNATIIQTNLSSAILDDADLSNASLFGVIFADVDLSLVKGLETVTHQGPSTIGIDTIYRSKGNIPRAFLGGAGVPDSFISYLHLLVGHPIDYYSCYISYSSKDQPFAERLYADLQTKGVRCWFAPENIGVGDKIRSRIDESIHLYDKLLLIVSQHSIISQWVQQEVEVALKKEHEEEQTILFPIRLDDSIMTATAGWATSIRNTKHIADFRHWTDHDTYQKALSRLIRDLKITVAMESNVRESEDEK